ncbi:MAG: AMP-binding protein [Verrucomicrobia bacterium]|nr:AMP-binding protein [Verrucomicrobiota bacterium]
MTYAHLLEEIAPPAPVAGSPQGLRATLVTLVRALVHGEDLACGDGVVAIAGTAPTGQERRWPGPSDFPSSPAAMIAASLRANRSSRVTFQTSGTSGPPKRSTHTLERLQHAVVTGEHHRGDVWGLAYPPTSIAGFQVCLQAWCNGNGIVDLLGVQGEEVLRRCGEWGVNRLSATPTFFRLLLPIRDPLPGLRSCTLGGEVADTALLQRVREAFPGARVHNVYALTEAGTVLRSEGEEFSIPDELQDHVRIQEGRLWLRHTLVAEDRRAGDWFDTGDLVEVTSRTPLRFRVQGRAGSVINVGGSKVNPEEVESILLSFPGIVGARVAGRRNSVTGMLLEAEVVWKDRPRPEEEVRAFLQSRLPPERVPRIFQAVNRLTLTASGKVKRDA